MVFILGTLTLRHFSKSIVVNIKRSLSPREDYRAENDVPMHKSPDLKITTAI